MIARGRMVQIPATVAYYLLGILRDELEANQSPATEEHELMAVAANALANGLQRLKSDEKREQRNDDARELGLDEPSRCDFTDETETNGSCVRQCVRDTGHRGDHELGPNKPRFERRPPALVTPFDRCAKQIDTPLEGVAFCVLQSGHSGECAVRS